MVSVQEGGGQVKGVQRLATRKVSVLEVVPIVRVYRPCTRKQVEKRADLQLVVKIWVQGLGGDLLSLQKQGKKGQTIGSEIEGVLGVMPVEGGAVVQTDDDACGQLTQKEIVLHSTQVVLGDGKGLEDDPFQGVLGGSFLQSFGVSQRHGWVQLAFANKERSVYNGAHKRWVSSMNHQVEGVLGRDQTNLDVHPVQETPVLRHDVCVQASRHVHFPAPGRQLSSDFQPAVVIALGVVKVMRRVPIIES